MAIPGLEGRFWWDGPIDPSPAAVDYGVELNRRKDDSADRVYPVFLIDRISGLRSAGDPEDVRDLVVGRQGEIPRRSFRRGKTVTIEGRVRATAMDDLYEYEDAILAAFDDQATEKVMVVDRHTTLDPSNEWSRFFRARALAVDIGEEQGAPQNASNGWERPAIISVRLSDRRYYDATLLDEVVTVADGDDVGTIECDVGGTVATDPVITVVGPSGEAKDPAYLATTAALPANTRTGNILTADNPGYLTDIDGPGLPIGTTLLVKNEASGLKNGLYDILDIGSGMGHWALERRPDADTSAEVVHGITVPVLHGDVNAGKTFSLSTADPIVLNTTALTFVDISTVLGLKLTNADTGKSLIFPALHMPGSTLVVDFRTRTVTLNGISREDLLDDDVSDWWDAGASGLDPADNQTVEVRSFTGAATTFDVDVTVAWYPAFA